jgi:hypothetical protein
MSNDTKLFNVYDTSATAQNPVRIHDLVFDGVVEQVRFTYGEATKLPLSKALKFQKAGFVVKDAEDVLIPTPSETPETVKTQLKVGEIIARYEELTNEALLLRVAILPGGEAFTRSSKKKELVDFLIESEKNRAKPADPTRVNDEGEGMSPVELATLVPDDATA